MSSITEIVASSGASVPVAASGALPPPVEPVVVVEGLPLGAAGSVAAAPTLGTLNALRLASVGGAWVKGPGYGRAGLAWDDSTTVAVAAGVTGSGVVVAVEVGVSAIGVGVAVGISGTEVAVAVAMLVGVGVAVGTSMRGVGVAVGISVGVGVAVGTSVAVGVAVGISVGVGVAVGISITGVGVAVGISVAVGVAVGMSVGVGVAVGIWVGVGVAVGSDSTSIPADAPLLSGLLSVVELTTLAEFVRVEPSGTDGSTSTT